MMVRRTPSGFLGVEDDLPFHIARGYDRKGSESTSHSTSETAKSDKSFAPEDYTQPYLKFMTDNPTIFHAVDTLTKQLSDGGYEYLPERKIWNLKPGGKYYTTRNSSSFIAFAVGKEYQPGNGVGIVAGHIDALTVKLKPVPKLPTKAGFVQMAVAPYAGGMNSTWWDRDLGIGGRVLVKTNSGIEERLVKLPWPIARIPTLAPHFGAAAQGPFNPETQMVPIIGLDNSDLRGGEASSTMPPGTFAATQPERLVKTISRALDIDDYSSIVNWELELFDIQPAQLGGLDKEFIFAGRIDDKLCCFAAIEGLLASSDDASSGIIKMVGCFDDEEIGSYLRQGARSNFMSSVIERISESTTERTGPNLLGQMMANSFLVSSDVIHSVNPNFLGAYLENHSPRLNVGVAVSADPNGHMTTDPVSTALLSRVAENCGSTLQVFQIRNDSRSGGTIGPMTSSRLGCRAIMLVDGLGDGVLVEYPQEDLSFLRVMSFGLLQGARMRNIKTEYVSCPSCGRTLFDLQEVTDQIRQRTGHLPGVSIAVMGCIVNGPGEMADADFGYVGGAPGKIDLYVGKEVVRRAIPMEGACDELIELIKLHDRWVEMDLEEEESMEERQHEVV